jgi:hypothetical protein
MREYYAENDGFYPFRWECREQLRCWAVTLSRHYNFVIKELERERLKALWASIKEREPGITPVELRIKLGVENLIAVHDIAGAYCYFCRSWIKGSNCPCWKDLDISEIKFGGL